MIGSILCKFQLTYIRLRTSNAHVYKTARVVLIFARGLSAPVDRHIVSRVLRTLSGYSLMWLCGWDVSFVYGCEVWL